MGAVGRGWQGAGPCDHPLQPVTPCNLPCALGPPTPLCFPCCLPPASPPQHIPSHDVETLPSGMLEPAAASGEHPRVTAAKQALQQRLKEQAA